VKPRKLPFLIIHVLLPVCAGGFIYLCWRNPNLLMFDWLRALGFEPAVAAVRSAVGVAPNSPRWFLTSLPDGLWVYALTALMALVWRGADFSPLKIFWLSTGFLLGAGSELGQMIHIVPGSFDPIDLLVCLIAAAVALVLTSSKMKFVRLNSQESK
jgi:hypothetical protein